MLKTNGVPLVSWKEKMVYLKAHVDQNSINLIETLDIIAQYISITHQFDRDVFTGLVEKLKELLSKHLSEKSGSSLVLSSVKRCLRKILSVLNP